MKLNIIPPAPRSFTSPVGGHRAYHKYILEDAWLHCETQKEFYCTTAGRTWKTFSLAKGCEGPGWGIALSFFALSFFALSFFALSLKSLILLSYCERNALVVLNKRVTVIDSRMTKERPWANRSVNKSDMSESLMIDQIALKNEQFDKNIFLPKEWFALFHELFWSFAHKKRAICSK